MSGLIGQRHMKTVMIIDVFTYDPWQELPSNISKFYCFNTVLYQRTLKDCKLDTKLRCCIHIPATLHPLLSGKWVSLMIPLLTY